MNWLAIFRFRRVSTIVDGGTGVSGIMTWADASRVIGVCGMDDRSRVGSMRVMWSSGGFSISRDVSPLVSFPEGPPSRAFCIVVGRAGSVGLVPLGSTDQEDLNDGCQEEEEDVDDADRKDGGVEPAGKAEIGQVGHVFALAKTKAVIAIARRIPIGRAGSERCTDSAAAAIRSMTCVVGDCSEATREADVENDGEETQKGNAGQAKREDDSEDGVKDSSTRHAFDCSKPSRDGEAVVGQHS